MKFKTIRAMSHNWTHSFMSAMNCIDSGKVSDEVYAAARAGRRVTISWVPEVDPDASVLTDRLRDSLSRYRSRLASHLNASAVDALSLDELRTEVYVDASHRMFVIAYARDRRGREYRQRVCA